jgi:hypothetical protein
MELFKAHVILEKVLLITGTVLNHSYLKYSQQKTAFGEAESHFFLIIYYF